jgi:O-antigen/teichoic acid export membrane protein
MSILYFYCYILKYMERTTTSAIPNTGAEAKQFKKSFFKNLFVSAGYTYVSHGLTFLSSIVIARMLSPENYGLVGLITVFTGFIAVFVDSGISLAVIKSDFGYTYYKSLDTLALLMGIGLFLITSLLAYPISIFYNNHALVLPTLVLATTFVFKSLYVVRAAILSKQLQFAYLGKVLLANTSLSIVLTIILAYAGLQHWAIIIPQVAAAILTTILYERKLKLKFNYYSTKHTQVALKYTKRIIGSLIGFNMVNYWSRNTDNLIVGKSFGINDLGVYNRAYTLLTLPLTLITGLFGTVLYPSLKKLKNDGGDVNAEYMFVLKLIGLIVFPIACALLLFPDLLVHLLWGPTWARVAQYLPYFGLLVLSQPLLSTIGNFLVLQGKEKTLMYSGWITSIFIVGSIIFGAMFSMIAMVQAYSLCFLIIVLPYNIVFVYYRVLKFDALMLLKFWGPVLSLSFGIWMGCYLNSPLLKLGSISLLLISLLVSSRTEIWKAVMKGRNKMRSRSQNTAPKYTLKGKLQVQQ